MYQLTVKSKKQLERATLRAQAQKPRIEEIGYGLYKVWSTNPATPWKYYNTGIEAALNGGYTVYCNCPTQPRLDRVTGEMKDCFCKHTAAAFPHFLMREKQYAAEPVLVAATAAQVQEMSDQEWASVELSAEGAAVVDDVEAMLEKDRMDIFGY